MKKILIIVFLIIANISFPQEHHKFVENDWIGIWKGNLNILYPSKIQEVPMQIEISKTDTHGKYKWFSKYGEGSSSISKEYFMIVKDENKGNWVIDEGNSIILDMYFTNNCFYSLFEVQNTILNSNYRLEGGKLFFEVLSAKTDTPNITGKNEGELYEVKSYPVFVVQKSVLIKE
jgi:hypothetical protein